MAWRSLTEAAESLIFGEEENSDKEAKEEKSTSIFNVEDSDKEAKEEKDEYMRRSKKRFLREPKRREMIQPRLKQPKDNERKSKRKQISSSVKPDQMETVSSVNKSPNGFSDDDIDTIFGWSEKILAIGIGRELKDPSIKQQRFKEFIAYYNDFKKNGTAQGPTPSILHEEAQDVLCLYVTCSPDELKDNKNIPKHFPHNSQMLPVVIRTFSGLPSKHANSRWKQFPDEWRTFKVASHVQTMEPGVCIGHFPVVAPPEFIGSVGTLGARYIKGDHAYLITCAHVVDELYAIHHPPFEENGITLAPHRNQTILSTRAISSTWPVCKSSHEVDVAACKLTTGITCDGLDISKAQEAKNGMIVAKTGAATHTTLGEVVDTEFVSRCKTYRNTIKIVSLDENTKWSDFGDSGAVVTTMDNGKEYCIGIHCAGTVKYGVACHVSNVLAELKELP